MTVKKRWKGRVCEIEAQDGKPYLCPAAIDATSYRKLLQSLYNEDIAITIEPWKNTTSNPQYRYYYGVVLELIAEHTGLDKETLDSVLKSKFLYEYIMVADKPEKHLISKTKITTTQFANYVEEVVAWAAGFLDLVIPEPNEAST